VSKFEMSNKRDASMSGKVLAAMVAIQGSFYL
jgi:hypothetical protein